MTLFKSLAGVAILAGFLGACQQAEKPAANASAAGEILPGSASDAMLPLDTVRSQSPLAPPPRASGEDGAVAADESSAAASDAPAALAGDVPAPSASGAPAPGTQ